MVYILHFNQEYKGCRHYIGYCKNLDDRVKEHRNGKGSPLVKAVINAGIDFSAHVVDQTGTRIAERKLKNQKHSNRFCPVCKAEGKNKNEAHRQDKFNAKNS